MPLLLALNLVIQVFFIVHVYRSGAPRYWAFIILLFPVAGCLAYYFLEVFPHSREARTARRAARDIAKALDPTKDLRAKAEELAICGNIDNRVALAEECITAGLADEAVKLYRSCLTGAYENDPHLLFGFARALVEQGATDEAAAAIARLRAAHSQYKPNEARLLHARVLEAQDDIESALAEYRALVPAYVGLEARCRYGLLLERLERPAEARVVFEQAATQARRAGILIETEEAWAKLARQRLATKPRG
jgi:hypothetical protein